MFDDAGKKIEKYASAVFSVGTVMVIISTIIVVVIGLPVLTPLLGAMKISQTYKFLIVIAVLVDAGVLIFFFYIACLMTAGFGQLVSNTAKSAADSGKIVSNTEQLHPNPGQTIISENSMKSNELPDL